MLSRLTNKFRYVPTGETSFTSIAKKKDKAEFQRITSDLVNSVEDNFHRTVALDQSKRDNDSVVGSVNTSSSSLLSDMGGAFLDAVAITVLSSFMSPVAAAGLFLVPMTLNPESDGVVKAALRKTGLLGPQKRRFVGSYSTESEKFEAQELLGRYDQDTYSRKKVGENTVYQAGRARLERGSYRSYVALDKEGQLAHTDVKLFPIADGSHRLEALKNGQERTVTDKKRAMKMVKSALKLEQRLRQANDGPQDLDSDPQRAVMEERRGFGELEYGENGSVSRAIYRPTGFLADGRTVEINRSQDNKLQVAFHTDSGFVHELNVSTDDSGKVREDLPFTERWGKAEPEVIAKPAGITHTKPLIHLSTKISSAAVGGASGFTLAVVNSDEVVDGAWKATDSSNVRAIKAENVDLFPLDGKATPVGSGAGEVANFAGLKRDGSLIPGDVAFTTYASGQWETHDGENLQQAAERVNQYGERHGAHDGEYSLNVSFRGDPSRYQDKTLVMIPTSQYESGEITGENAVVPKFVKAVADEQYKNHIRYGLVAGENPEDSWIHALDFKGNS